MDSFTPDIAGMQARLQAAAAALHVPSKVNVGSTLDLQQKRALHLDDVSDVERAHLDCSAPITKEELATMEENVPVNVQLDALLFADIEINALRIQVIDRDLEILRMRTEALKLRKGELTDQRDALNSRVGAIVSNTHVSEVTLIDRAQRLVEVK